MRTKLTILTLTLLVTSQALAAPLCAMPCLEMAPLAGHHPAPAAQDTRSAHHDHEAAVASSPAAAASILAKDCAPQRQAAAGDLVAPAAKQLDDILLSASTASVADSIRMTLAIASAPLPHRSAAALPALVLRI